MTTLNLTGLALIGLGTGVGWIPFAFAAAGAVSGLITGAFEEAGTLEEKLYNATQGMVDGMLYWETLGVIGIAAPGLVSNPTGAMITEAAMETAVDILYAIKDNVTLAPGSMAWIFLTNIITTGGTSFKQLDEAWSYLKGAKNLDDFKLRAQKLIKGGSNTTIKPSGSYNPNAKPGGMVTKITDNMDDATRRSLTRENEAAETLAKNGYDVEQNPKVEGTTRNPDYIIEGEVFDCYSPAQNTSVRNIASTIEEKVVKKGQADNVVLNLDDWTGDINALIKQLNDYPIEGLNEVLVVQNGKVTSIYP